MIEENDDFIAHFDCSFYNKADSKDESNKHATLTRQRQHLLLQKSDNFLPAMTDVKIRAISNFSQADNQTKECLANFSRACNLAEDNNKDDYQLCGRPNQAGKIHSKL